VRVEVNPLALSQYGIGCRTSAAAISNSNANAPKGAIDLGDQRWQIYTNDNARDAAQYRSLIVANRSDRTVRLEDVARSWTYRTGRPRTLAPLGSIMAIRPSRSMWCSSRAPTSSNCRRVRAQLPQLARMIDPKIRLIVTTDRSVSIRASLRQVERALALAVAMVILVVFAFLRSVRAALIPTVVVPVSLIARLVRCTFWAIPRQFLAHGADYCTALWSMMPSWSWKTRFVSSRPACRGAVQRYRGRARWDSRCYR